MQSSLTEILAAAGGTGIAAGFFGWLTSRLQVKKEIAAAAAAAEANRLATQLAERNQPIEHYHRYTMSLETRIQTLEGDHRQCIDHQIKCEREMGELKGQLALVTQLLERHLVVKPHAETSPAVEVDTGGKAAPVIIVRPAISAIDSTDKSGA
jgi:hypothetical protein